MTGSDDARYRFPVLTRCVHRDRSCAIPQVSLSSVLGKISVPKKVTYLICISLTNYATIAFRSGLSAYKMQNAERFCAVLLKKNRLTYRKRVCELAVNLSREGCTDVWAIRRLGDRRLGDNFYPRDAMLAWSLRQRCVCLSVCLSVTHWYCA